ncbi:hypothetical protein Tco_0063942 [Tanacetum coccineum]
MNNDFLRSEWRNIFIHLGLSGSEVNSIGYHQSVVFGKISRRMKGELQLDDKLNFVEEPVEIIDREIKQLKRSRIPKIKVRWNSKRGPEFTWDMRWKSCQISPSVNFNQTSSSINLGTRFLLASAAICKNGGVTSYTTEFEKKAKDERKRYIDLVEKSMKDIIKDVVKNQLPHILAKEVSEFATPVIQSTITKSLENVVLAKSSSQPKSTFNAATLLTEFELKKILLDKMQKTYYLKRDHEDKDKDEDPPAGLDQGLKKQKTSKDVVSHPAKAETRGVNKNGYHHNTWCLYREY